MIYGIGVDIASVARIAQVRGRHCARLEQRVLTTLAAWVDVAFGVCTHA